MIFNVLLWVNEYIRKEKLRDISIFDNKTILYISFTSNYNNIFGMMACFPKYTSLPLHERGGVTY